MSELHFHPGLEQGKGGITENEPRETDPEIRCGINKCGLNRTTGAATLWIPPTRGWKSGRAASVFSEGTEIALLGTG